jgi:hypothetical protein
MPLFVRHDKVKMDIFDGKVPIAKILPFVIKVLAVRAAAKVISSLF